MPNYTIESSSELTAPDQYDITVVASDPIFVVKGSDFLRVASLSDSRNLTEDVPNVDGIMITTSIIINARGKTTVDVIVAELESQVGLLNTISFDTENEVIGDIFVSF